MPLLGRLIIWTVGVLGLVAFHRTAPAAAVFIVVIFYGTFLPHDEGEEGPRRERRGVGTP